MGCDLGKSPDIFKFVERQFYRLGGRMMSMTDKLETPLGKCHTKFYSKHETQNLKLRKNPCTPKC
jgi:hypothetical protein